MTGLTRCMTFDPRVALGMIEYIRPWETLAEISGLYWFETNICKVVQKYKGPERIVYETSKYALEFYISRVDHAPCIKIRPRFQGATGKIRQIHRYRNIRTLGIPGNDLETMDY